MAISVILFISKSLIFFRAKKELLYQVIFLALTGFTMTWFLSVLYLPIFWATSIGITQKIIIFIVVATSNFLMGSHNFKKKWIGVGLKYFESEFATKKLKLNWDSVLKIMSIQYRVFIPGIPRGAESVLSLFLIIFMIAGLNLRSSFPVFSVFAWGIPAIVIASFFLQVAGSYISQAFIIRAKERALKVSLPSV